MQYCGGIRELSKELGEPTADLTDIEVALHVVLGKRKREGERL